MKTFKVLGSVLGLSLLLGPGVFAEIEGGEPGTSLNPKDNVPEKIQRSDPYDGKFPDGSGPGTRSDALTGLKKEVPVNEDHEALQENVDKTHGGAAAMAAEELEQKSQEKSH